MMDKEEIKRGIEELKPWFHYFEIEGTPTKAKGDMEPINYPRGLWDAIRGAIPKNLTGQRVLDIGCNAGFFSFEAARRGASVLGVDTNQDCLGCKGNCIEQANFLREYLESKGEHLDVDFWPINFLDLINVEPFDIIFFLGVYYHLENHQKAFKILKSLARKGGYIIVETAVMGEPSYFSSTVNNCYHGDITNFFVPSKEYIKEDMTTNGFEIITELEHYDNTRAIYIIRRKNDD